MAELARKNGGEKFCVLVVGCGRIGSAVAVQLLRSGDFGVTVMDPTETGRENAVRLGLPFVEGALFGATSMQQALWNVDAVVAAVPSSATKAIKEEANRAGVHYVDLDDQFGRESAGSDEELTALDIPHCGVFPGLLTTVLLDLLAGQMVNAEVDVAVGVLPRERVNRLGYGLVWDVAGLVREYTQPAPCILQGVVSTSPALSHKSRVTIAGEDYETFVSGSTSAHFLHQLVGKVNNLMVRTIRFPGHLDYIKFLTEELKLGSRNDLLKLLLSTALPENKDDKLLIHVAVVLQGRGFVVRQEYEKQVIAFDDGTMRMTALQRTASSHICAILDLVRQGMLPERGRIAQEAMPIELLKENRFLSWFFDDRIQSGDT